MKRAVLVVKENLTNTLSDTISSLCKNLFNYATLNSFTMACTDSLEDADKVLLKWLNAINEFCRSYNRLNQFIKHKHTAHQRVTAQQTEQLRKLLLLREQVSETMAALLSDMNLLLPSPSCARPLHTKLQVHASLLNELNQQIDVALNFARPMAYA